MKPKLIIIADDFTGAGDTGVQFSKAGLKTAVVTNLSQDADMKQDPPDVLVLDTESRFDTKEAAYAKILSAVNSARGTGDTPIYKKIDSTMRGNVGSEIDAIMDAAGISLAIIAPAYPKAGRTTAGGVQMVHSIPLENTEFAQDPRTPVCHSYIPDILSLQSRRKAGCIAAAEVSRGPCLLAEKIAALAAQGIEMVVIDAMEERNLEVIAAAISFLHKPVLAVGSAGLAQYLPKYLNILPGKPVKKGGIVIIAGSVSQTTLDQIAYAWQNQSLGILDIDIKNLFFHPSEEHQRILEEAKKHISQDTPVIIRSAKDRKSVELARELGKRQGMDHDGVSDAIARFLGQTAKNICEHLPLAGLVLTGGNTAIQAVSSMGIAGLLIKDEILPGIPYGYFISKNFHDFPVVTKAGGFGQKDALIKIISFLQSRQAEIP